MIRDTAEIELKHGQESASYIIDLMESEKPSMICGSVENTGLVTNSPQNGVAEVACLVNRDGIQPTCFEELPMQLAALDQTHRTVHDMVATSVIEGNRETAFYALMLDSLTAAVCSPVKIRQIFDEMASVQADYLPDWMQA